MGFSGQEYWSGLPCPPVGDRPDPWLEPESSALQADSLPLSYQGNPMSAFIQPLFIPSIQLRDLCFPSVYGLIVL